MAKTYELFPNASFYLFCDDDTYILKKAVLRKFSDQDPEVPKATGKSYCTWDRLSETIKPKRNCHPFLQGGAGVVLSHGLLSRVHNELINCSLRFNNPDFAGSMRFAICMERTVGASNWTEGAYIDNWQVGFHSSEPKVEISEFGMTESPASFHRMNLSDFKWTKNKQFVEFNSKTNKYIIDLGLYPFVRYYIPFFKSGNFGIWRFGLDITIPCLGKKIKPKGNFEPIVESGKVIGVQQKYERITMRLFYNPYVEDGNIIEKDISGRNGAFDYEIHPLEIRKVG